MLASTPQLPPPRVILAAIMLLSAELCFASVSALVKYLSVELASEQLVFFRNIMAFLVLLPWLWRKGPAAFKTVALKFHLTRGIAGLAAMYLFFYAIAALPLAQATLVLLLTPFLIPIIGHFWLGEQAGRQTWVAIAIGFVGVFVFLNPVHMTLSPALLLAFTAAVLAAYTKTLIRRMSATESTSKIVFYFACLATLISALPLFWHWRAIDPEHWLALIGMGALATAGQLGMTKAFSLAPAASVGVFTYSSVIFAAIFGYVFWNEPVFWHMAAGTLIIMVAGYFALRSHRRPRSVGPDPQAPNSNA